MGKRYNKRKNKRSKITGPALTMSLSARNNSASGGIIVSPNHNGIMIDDNCGGGNCSANADEMRQQWISIGGWLGKPDAATPIDDNDHADNNDDEQMMMMTTTTAAGAENAMAASSNVVEEENPMEDNIRTEVLFKQLHEALALESKFQPSLFLPHESHNGEITIGTRDGAAHVLRCLKVWYDLPSDILFAAINLVDRFLTKMKVRPKHMACISVSSLYLATSLHGLPHLDTEDLVVISQCRCTPGDLERMAGIIEEKLGVQPNCAPITAITFLRVFYNIFENAAKQLGLHELFKNAISLTDLEMRLEILICDASCASIRASELSLVLICTQMDAHITNLKDVNQNILGLVDYAIELQKMCKIPETSFFHSHSTVVKILSNYNQQHKMPYRQRLVWKLSSRTMRSLRPTDRLTSYLPTIEEHNMNGGMTSNLSRLRTGSLSSEDGEDWPSSPVVPVCEKI